MNGTAEWRFWQSHSAASMGMAPQIARMSGPVVVTTLLIGWGTPGWLVLGGLFLVAGLLFGPAVRWAERGRVDHRVSTRRVVTLTPVAAVVAARREQSCGPAPAPASVA
jgi:hypothetical protein